MLSLNPLPMLIHVNRSGLLTKSPHQIASIITLSAKKIKDNREYAVGRYVEINTLQKKKLSQLITVTVTVTSECRRKASCTRGWFGRATSTCTTSGTDSLCTPSPSRRYFRRRRRTTSPLTTTLFL
jgi:hypothetical protein